MVGRHRRSLRDVSLPTHEDRPPVITNILSTLIKTETELSAGLIESSVITVVQYSMQFQG
jgi:hypothetical protein